jgi:hypothetical protein
MKLKLLIHLAYLLGAKTIKIPNVTQPRLVFGPKDTTLYLEALPNIPTPSTIIMVIFPADEGEEPQTEMRL